MPLLRWPRGSYESQLWGINFLMMTNQGNTIRCKVTRGTLDKLLNDNGTLTVRGQKAVFDEHRSQIESIASGKYDSNCVEDGMIIVRPEDVEMAELAASESKAS